MYTIIIGNKNLSSWSLRPYLALRAAKVPFEEILVRLDQPETRASIAGFSPAGKVPILKIVDKDRTQLVWDSLAICETIAERHPEAKLWPHDSLARAEARSYAAEMHSGFADIREQLPMDFSRNLPIPELRAATEAQIARVIAAWSEALTKYQGDFLFGDFSVADCMYGPVVSRFHTYGIVLPDTVKAYCARMMALPAMQAWLAAAEGEVAAGWK